MIFGRVKSLDAILATAEKKSLHRTLGAFQLMLFGIGCVIGTGIFVLTAAGAQKAGPGLMLAFAIAGLICIVAALCYAEIAAMIPVAGSAYTYGYATLGELPAWIIGWDLLLEYMVAACLVSIGWSAYLVNLLNNILRGWGLALPPSLVNAPIEWNTEIHKFVSTGAVINIPAIFIVLLLTGLLVRGIKESSRVNMIIVIVKIAVIVFFIVLAVWHIKPSNWTPFMPFGFGGVMTAAAIVFLAFVGFDAISTAAEEAKNPQRDMPRAIMSSLAVATILYMAVSAIMTGTVPYDKLGVPDPVALVLNELRMPWASSIVSVGALAGITSVTWQSLVMMAIGGLLIFRAISREYEPLLLLPIGAGAILAKVAFWLPQAVVVAVFPRLANAERGALRRADDRRAAARRGDDVRPRRPRDDGDGAVVDVVAALVQPAVCGTAARRARRGPAQRRRHVALSLIHISEPTRPY